MIDFGLSKRYVNVATGKHIPMRHRQHYVGTQRFISESVENGEEPCRRDDLISAGYVALLLLVGKLPWQNLSGQQICKCKRSISHKSLCKGLPDSFVKYFDYSCGLAYDDTPDYTYLKQLIRNSCVHEGMQEVVVADPVRDGCSVHERKKARHTKHSEAGKKPSPTNKSDTNAFSYKAVLDEISSAAVKKITHYIKERLPDTLARLTK